MAKSNKDLTVILRELGILKPEQATQALDMAKKTGESLASCLQRSNLATEDQVTKAMAIQYEMEYINLDTHALAAMNVAPNLIPQEMIKRYNVLPLAKENNKLKVLIGDPDDLEALETLKFRVTMPMVFCLAAPSRLKKHIEGLFAEEKNSIDEAVRQMSVDRGASIDVKELAVAADAPIVKLVTSILTEAVKLRASDIHIEPFKDRVRVRYRIDGVCVQRDAIPKRLQGPVLARLKIMSGMDIAEKRLPQDGRIKLPMGPDMVVDFRVSALPAYHGESVVLRILRADAVKIGVANMGFDDDDYQRFKKIISRPNGIFLVTGPTGSGKTTTLYGALNELNRPDRKIITAEDPVEYNFPGINQCQVKEAIGLSFAKILRSMLRQAPNVILVGEIRDLEVAEVAIQAALTGHLVFSTLHTNDAPSAVTRLIDMGVKPFLVATSIQAILAQRLIRTLCKQCKAPDPEPDLGALRLLGMKEADLMNRTLYKPVGCPACNNSGYKGRLGIFEMLIMNSELREMAFKRTPSNILRKAAIASGMKTLLMDGRSKVLNGITTAPEIARVTQAEGVVMD